MAAVTLYACDPDSPEFARACRDRGIQIIQTDEHEDFYRFIGEPTMLAQLIRDQYSDGLEESEVQDLIKSIEQ